eukprot:gene7768-10553_t
MASISDHATYSVEELTKILQDKKKKYESLSAELFDIDQKYMCVVDESKNTIGLEKKKTDEYVELLTDIGLIESDILYQQEIHNYKENLANEHTKGVEDEINLSKRNLENALNKYQKLRNHENEYQFEESKKTDTSRISCLNSIAFCTYTQSLIRDELKHPTHNKHILQSNKSIKKFKTQCNKIVRKSGSDLKMFYEVKLTEYRRQQRILGGRQKEIVDYYGLKSKSFELELATHQAEQRIVQKFLQARELSNNGRQSPKHHNNIDNNHNNHKMYNNKDAVYKFPSIPNSFRTIAGSNTVHTNNTTSGVGTSTPSSSFRVAGVDHHNHGHNSSPSKASQKSHSPNFYVNKSPGILSPIKNIDSLKMKLKNELFNREEFEGKRIDFVPDTLFQYHPNLSNHNNNQHRNHSLIPSHLTEYDDKLLKFIQSIAELEGKHQQLLCIKEGLDVQLLNQSYQMLAVCTDLNQDLDRNVDILQLVHNHNKEPEKISDKRLSNLKRFSISSDAQNVITNATNVMKRRNSNSVSEDYNSHSNDENQFYRGKTYSVLFRESLSNDDENQDNNDSQSDNGDENEQDDDYLSSDPKKDKDEQDKALGNGLHLGGKYRFALDALLMKSSAGLSKINNEVISLMQASEKELDKLK